MGSHFNDGVVALFTRAWIEITPQVIANEALMVALFTRAWIEMDIVEGNVEDFVGRPLHEGVD